MSRDRVYALGATALLAMVLLVGFRELGSPSVQRATTADTKRIADFKQIASQLFISKRIPASLAELGKTWTDPEKGTPYEYHADTATEYRLCASFNGSNTDASNVFWSHGPGQRCFNLSVKVFH